MLTQYLTENGLTLNEFAKTCGTSASTILRIKDGEVAPSKRVARALWIATKGQVTPNDIYGLHYSVTPNDPTRVHHTTQQDAQQDMSKEREKMDGK
ncbi:helix-turn-helix domain-containing protein [Yoonia sp. R2-816]|uniref:helix-turn-helix domain-containing protein n=1 Tax=Yoonia sp. R2-816 TaxID=3342638 RepID=UPI00372AC878